MTMHEPYLQHVDISEDRAAIGRLMSRFLDSVSFEPGCRPAYRDLPELFIASANLIKASTDTPEISDIEEFIRTRQQTVDTGELTSFHEAEMHASTDLFGNVAHRISIYHKHGMLNGAAIDVRGAISTQLIRTPEGWRISAMAWDDERPGHPLPAHLAGLTAGCAPHYQHFARSLPTSREDACSHRRAAGPVDLASGAHRHAGGNTRCIAPMDCHGES